MWEDLKREIKSIREESRLYEELNRGGTFKQEDVGARKVDEYLSKVKRTFNEVVTIMKWIYRPDDPVEEVKRDEREENLLNTILVSRLETIARIKSAETFWDAQDEISIYIVMGEGENGSVYIYNKTGGKKLHWDYFVKIRLENLQEIGKDGLFRGSLLDFRKTYLKDSDDFKGFLSEVEPPDWGRVSFEGEQLYKLDMRGYDTRGKNMRYEEYLERVVKPLIKQIKELQGDLTYVPIYKEHMDMLIECSNQVMSQRTGGVTDDTQEMIVNVINELKYDLDNFTVNGAKI